MREQSLLEATCGDLFDHIDDLLDFPKEDSAADVLLLDAPAPGSPLSARIIDVGHGKPAPLMAPAPAAFFDAPGALGAEVFGGKDGHIGSVSPRLPSLPVLPFGWVVARMADFKVEFGGTIRIHRPPRSPAGATTTHLAMVGNCRCRWCNASPIFFKKNKNKISSSSRFKTAGRQLSEAPPPTHAPRTTQENTYQSQGDFTAWCLRLPACVNGWGGWVMVDGGGVGGRREIVIRVNAAWFGWILRPGLLAVGGPIQGSTTISVCQYEYLTQLIFHDLSKVK